MNEEGALTQSTSTWMDKIVCGIELISEGAGRFASYLLVPLLLVFLYEIIARNVFNAPTTWAYGTCYIIGGCAAVLSFGYAMKNGAMVRIDAFYAKLPAKAKCILDLCLFAVLFFPLTVSGTIVCVREAMTSVAAMELISTGSWQAPIWPTKIVMAVSMMILTLQGVAEVLKLIQRLQAMKKEERV